MCLAWLILARLFFSRQTRVDCSRVLQGLLLKPFAARERERKMTKLGQAGYVCFSLVYFAFVMFKGSFTLIVFTLRLATSSLAIPVLRYANFKNVLVAPCINNYLSLMGPLDITAFFFPFSTQMLYYNSIN